MKNIKYYIIDDTFQCTICGAVFNNSLKISDKKMFLKLLHNPVFINNYPQICDNNQKYFIPKNYILFNDELLKI